MGWPPIKQWSKPSSEIFSWIFPFTLPTSVSRQSGDRMSLSCVRYSRFFCTGAQRNIISQEEKSAKFAVMVSSTPSSFARRRERDGVSFYWKAVKVGVSLINAFKARAMEPPINPKPINPKCFADMERMLLSNVFSVWIHFKTLIFVCQYWIALKRCTLKWKRKSFDWKSYKIIV